MGNSESVIAEGKTKKVINIGCGMVLIRSKDDITAGDGEKHDVMNGKAIDSTMMTCNIFQLLNRLGVPTHFIGRVNETTFQARNVKMIPIELVVRRIATGSYLKRNNVEEGTVFEDLVVEMFDKDDSLHDPKLEFVFKSGVVRRYIPSRPQSDESLIDETLLSESRYEYVTPEFLLELTDIGKNVFTILEQAWAELGGVLFDFKIECGFDSETSRILVADVIDLDSCRLQFDGVSVDKDSYRKGSKPLDVIKVDYAKAAVMTEHFANIMY